MIKYSAQAYKWFAWRPVRDRNTEKILWLKYVYRFREQAKIMGVTPSDWWAYEEINPKNKTIYY